MVLAPLFPMMDRRLLLTNLALLGIAPARLLSDDDVRPSRLITDFRTKGMELNWRTVNDTVMGGKSTSRLKVSDQGIAHFSGRLSLENNGGFASFRSTGILPDLAGCNALVLRAKGDGRKYQLRVRTGTGWRVPNYQAEFSTTKSVWREHVLPLADFIPGWRGRTLEGQPSIDPSKITSLGILLGDKKRGSFELHIDTILAVNTGT